MNPDQRIHNMLCDRAYGAAFGAGYSATLEFHTGNGRADVVVLTDDARPVLVVEAKPRIHAPHEVRSGLAQLRRYVDALRVPGFLLGPLYMGDTAERPGRLWVGDIADLGRVLRHIGDTAKASTA